MIVKVGNASYNSRQVPIALVLDDQDILALGTIQLKGSSPAGVPHPSLYVRFPQDVPPQVLAAWLAEAAPELDLKTLAPRLFGVGKVKEN